jgi:hypothetical protein
MVVGFLVNSDGFGGSLDFILHVVHPIHIGYVLRPRCVQITLRVIAPEFSGSGSLDVVGGVSA